MHSQLAREPWLICRILSHKVPEQQDLSFTSYTRVPRIFPHYGNTFMIKEVSTKYHVKHTFSSAFSSMSLNTHYWISLALCHMIFKCINALGHCLEVTTDIMEWKLMHTVEKNVILNLSLSLSKENFLDLLRPEIKRNIWISVLYQSLVLFYFKYSFFQLSINNA